MGSWKQHTAHFQREEERARERGRGGGERERDYCVRRFGVKVARFPSRVPQRNRRGRRLETTQHGALFEFHRRFKGVSKAFQRRFKAVSKAIQRRSKGGEHCCGGKSTREGRLLIHANNNARGPRGRHAAPLLAGTQRFRPPIKRGGGEVTSLAHLQQCRPIRKKHQFWARLISFVDPTA